MDRKQALWHANKEAWDRGKADPSLYKNLDSNIKKNTAFIKKCKTALTADSSQQLLNDIKKLSLEKYISEIVGSVLEGMAKCKNSTDISACAEVISALHQRFPDTFTLLLTFGIFKILQLPSKQYLSTLAPEQREKEETSRILRQRTYLRIAVELWLVGVLRNIEDGIPSLASANLEGVEAPRDGVAGMVGSTKEKKKDDKEIDKDSKTGGFVYRILKDLLSSDMVQHTNIQLAASFLKNFGQEILGIVPRKQRAAEQHNDEVTEESNAVTAGGLVKETGTSAVTPENRALIKDLLDQYYHSVTKHLLKEHTYIKRMDSRNHEILFSRGELSDETKKKYEKATKAYEKLLANTQTLAETLDVEMPDLPEDDNVAKVSIVSSGNNNAFADGKENNGNGAFEDEDARKFYEDLPDLRVLVPGVFLESQLQKKNDDEKEIERTDEPEKAEGESEAKEDEKDSSAEDQDTALDDSEDVGQDDTEEDDVDSSVIVDKTISTDKDEASVKPTHLALVDALLARLPTLANRDLIDGAAVEFCYVNSKTARKRLAKALLGVPRQRVDLLPYYSRLIAVLNNYYPDIGETIVAALEHEFKGLQRKKTQDLLESRVKNIRFISELTKFRVAPSHTIFHMFKVALDDFNNQNVDVVCNLLETCGRFLLKSPETNQRMTTMLETVMRKKTVQHLDNRQSMMVENAYYQASPPDRAETVKKERPPMEIYIRKLAYVDLNKKSLDKVLKQMRKLHWEDPNIRHILYKIFQKIWKVKYGNIHLIAILASGLSRYHSDFGMQLVDSVIEEIRVGLEQNIFKHNQRRIAVAKYLGELYNYRMVDSPIIFDTLYTIVTLGHEFGRPARDRFCPMDAPNDFFRIRLCCTLLDTCGMCFDRGSSKTKLDNFLAFFQMYILSKLKPPMDVDFMVTDTLEMLRPQLQIFTSYEEANEAVDRMLLEQLKSVQGSEGKVQDDGFEESELSESSSDEGEDDDRMGSRDLEDEREDGYEEVIGNDGDEDVVVLKHKEEPISTEDDDEFEREFSKMMSESIESRKFEKKSVILDVPIPMNLRGAQDRRTAAQSRVNEDDSHMSFTLLTKKGNRQQVKVMEVPSDSVLAVSTRSKQEAEREEQQQLKQLVLNYEEREEAAARQAAIDERAKLRGSFRGKRVLHLGGGAGGQAYGGRR
ncbi:armadillo-type protein [Phycomyces nitens]|nr:armadillo-type protein [Phycomyces nitens]